MSPLQNAEFEKMVKFGISRPCTDEGEVGMEELLLSVSLTIFVCVIMLTNAQSNFAKGRFVVFLPLAVVNGSV